MDPKKFNFLPETYEKIIYRHAGDLDITSPNVYVSETILSDVGYYLPILLVSTDGEKWFNTDYPNRDASGIEEAVATLSVRGDGFFIMGTRSTVGKLYYRVLGIKI